MVSESIKKLVERYCDFKESSIKTSAETDKKILDDAFMAYEESKTGSAKIKVSGEHWKNKMQLLIAEIREMLEKVGTSVEDKSMKFSLCSSKWQVPAFRKEQRLKESTVAANKVRSCAILRAMYESGIDYVSCFVPVVLESVPDYEFVDASSIKHELKNYLDIPELAVKKILDVARKSGYVDFDEKNELYHLVSDTTERLIEKRQVVAERIKELTQRIQCYYINNKIFPNTSVARIIEDFIGECGSHLDFLRTERTLCPPRFQVEDRYFKTLTQFLRDPTTEPAYLTTFREFAMGSIISKALEWTDRDSAGSAGLKKCRLFLDTSFVFSLLDLHERRVSEPVKEIYKEFLTWFDFRPKVFDFTVEQMKRIIYAYSPENMVCMSDTRIHGIYNTFMRFGWDKEHAEKYAEKLPEVLARNGITIYDTGMILNRIDPKENKSLSGFVSEHRGFFTQYKPACSEYGIQHDLAAIMMIQKIRGRTIYELGNTKAFFLTSDRKLAEFCQREMGHRDRGSISEVALDTSFASMLWFLQKDQRAQFPLDIIIAAYSRNWFISRNLWEKFTLVLSQMAPGKKIGTEQVPNIFYKNIQDVLSEVSDKDIEKVTEQLIIAKVDESHTDQEAVLAETHQMEGVAELGTKQEKLVGLKKEAMSLTKECARLQTRLITIKILIYAILALTATIGFVVLWFLLR